MLRMLSLLPRCILHWYPSIRSCWWPSILCSALKKTGRVSVLLIHFSIHSETVQFYQHPNVQIWPIILQEDELQLRSWRSNVTLTCLASRSRMRIVTISQKRSKKEWNDEEITYWHGCKLHRHWSAEEYDHKAVFLVNTRPLSLFLSLLPPSLSLSLSLSLSQSAVTSLPQPRSSSSSSSVSRRSCLCSSPRSCLGPRSTPSAPTKRWVGKRQQFICVVNFHRRSGFRRLSRSECRYF